MLAYRPCRPAILLLAGVIGPAVGCSNDSARSSRQETASSSPTPAVMADSGIRDSASAPATSQPDTPASTPKKLSSTVSPAVKAPKSRASAPRTSPRPAAAKPGPDSTATTQPRTDSATTAPQAESGPSQEKWLTYDAAKNTVTFELNAGPFMFNGFRNGEGTLIVPSKANIVINFANKDGTPHSAEVIPGEGPIPNGGGDPAIPRAYTSKLLEGLPQEATDAMRFSVADSGTYRISCGVPGHGLSGMWIWFKVDPAAKAPSFGPTKN